MTTPIASSIDTCLKSFHDTIQLTRGLSERAQDFQIDAWDDELGRLRIWAANTGAHELYQASLDFRLRDASHLRDQILSLLDSLLAGLNDAKDLVAEVTESEQKTESKQETESEQETESKQEKSMGKNSDDEGSLGEMKDLQITIASIIKSLFTMSILVRKPARHDSRMAILSRSEVIEFEPYAYAHVRGKYPKADEAIVSRLASAITRRRIYIKHQAMDAAKLRERLADGFGDSNASDTNVSDRITTDPQGEHMDFGEGKSDPKALQTPCTPNLAGRGDVVFPPLPEKHLHGRPFKCPICYHIIKLDDNQLPLYKDMWENHVLEDLRAWMCLSVNCVTPHRLYARRDEWIEHVENCPAVWMDGDYHCTLCAFENTEEVSHNQHIAQHLQDLALLALPQDPFDLKNDFQMDKSAQASRIQTDSYHMFATISSVPADGEVNEGPAKAEKYDDPDQQDSSTKPGASDIANIGLKRSNRHLTQEEIGKEEQPKARRKRGKPSSMMGWWQCCHDNNPNNPALSAERCTSCGHFRCQSCRSMS
ncbi:MAG: hypothetical protein HETSPECPRED_002383 [Heterodermia speciosa]|uniref:Uncharacterized protein n=1 Tax=Heterodermia speciosa TaxID=116794 RepID=A0A8H3J440_9LECA|nr:MAG: hypothetical protein HETSPECPRED_002383 [Heterodermia speciosa]